jgi:nicotinamidase-related amidase
MRALLLIDFINEFLHPQGKITPQGMGKFCEENNTLLNVQKLIRHFRTNQEEIIWIHLGFHENYDNCSRVSPRFSGIPELGILKEHTWSTAFLEELEYSDKEKTITKIRMSPFYQTDLEAYLREKRIDEIVLAGVATDLAISSCS